MHSRPFEAEARVVFRTKEKKSRIEMKSNIKREKIRKIYILKKKKNKEKNDEKNR